MFTQTLLPNTVRALNKIDPSILPRQTYLAGGTALALQIGHRVSVDLDFFTPEKFDENALANQFSRIENFTLKQASPLTILGKIEETEISLFTYPYKIVEPPIKFEQILIASRKDIAAMKIHALEDRGAKRDFVDVFFLAKRFSLIEMLKFYDTKYGCLKDHLYGILKSLIYFEDGESDPLPRMLVPASWPEIKTYFLAQAKKLSLEKILDGDLDKIFNS